MNVKYRKPNNTFQNTVNMSQRSVKAIALKRQKTYCYTLSGTFNMGL
jgi:hypothetical protein